MKSPARTKEQRPVTTETALVPEIDRAGKLGPQDKPGSVVALLGRYMGLEAGASSENTVRATKRDLQALLSYFQDTTGTRAGVPCLRLHRPVRQRGDVPPLPAGRLVGPAVEGAPVRN
jgi:hypothetical protein